MTVPAAEELWNRYGTAHRYVWEAAELLDEIDALHQPETIMGVLWCSAEHERWPCPTARLLHPARKEDK